MRRPFVTEFAHGLALEFDAVGAVDKAVEDGVGDCGVADQFVPTCWRELTGDQRGGDAVPVVEQFQEVAVLCGAGLFQSQSSITSSWVLASFLSSEGRLPSACLPSQSR